MARNRWELEENRKKENKTETPTQFANRVTSQLKANASAKNTSSKSSGKSSGGRSKKTTTKTTGNAAKVTKSTKSSSTGRSSGGFSNRSTVANSREEILSGGAARRRTNIDSRTGTNTSRGAQRESDLAQLKQNATDWWFADQPGRLRLQAENDAIRARHGWTYNDRTGHTFMTPGGYQIRLTGSVPKEVDRIRSYDKQNWLSTAGHNIGAGLAGISQGFYNTLDFLLPDQITPQALQDYIDQAKSNAEGIRESVRRYNYERGGTIGGVAGDLFQSAVGMLPQAVVALMSGGASTAGSLAGSADDAVSGVISALRNNAGAMTSFLSTVGTDYEQAKADGASDAEAALSAILSSAATAGIETLGGVDVPNVSTSRIRNAVRTALEEGTEEAVQGVVQNAVQGAVYDQSRPLTGSGGVFDAERMLQDFGGGALLGGAFGAARSPAGVNTKTPTTDANRVPDTQPQQTQTPDTIDIGGAQVERGASQITSPTAALSNDPVRANPQNIGFTPLNLESMLNRLNPMSTAATRAMRNVQRVYPQPTQRVQPTLQAAQPQRIQPTLQTAQAAQPRVQPTIQAAQQTAQPRVQPTLQTAAQASMDALRRVASPESSVGAAQSNFDPYTHMANEYGTIEPGENPARIVDVPISTDGSDRVRRFARTAMEASATPDEMIPEFERNVANGLFSYNPRSDESSLNKATQTITQKGYDGALSQWEDVTSGRRTANKDDIVLAQMLYSEAAKVGDTQLAMQLAAEIAAEGTRAGQNVQALRLLKRTTPEGKLYYIRKAVDNIQNDLNKARGKKAPQIEINDALAQGLLDAKTDADANAAMDAIYDDVANQIPATFGDRLNAWRYFAMLGNPRTHIRNVIGNIVYQIPTRVSNKISATLQKALPQEKRTRSVTRNRAAKDFAKSDYENMKNVISGDAYTSEMTEVQRRQRLYPKPIQAIMDLNSKALDAEDQLFKRTTYINSMADFLTARGADVNNIDPNLLEQARTHAIEDAKRATFQDASALADAIGRIENKNKATKLVIGGLLPFKRTPINIAKRGFELSPLGLIKGITVDLNKVRKGTMNATEAIDNISQGLTGTSLAVLGYFLASNGILSASSPENDKERNFDAAQGSQEYALNIGPYSYTIDWAAPAALPMFVGAEFYNALTAKYDDEEQAFKQATDALSRLFEPMINMTMLSGISSTIQSATYSQTNPLFAIAGNIAQNYAGQVVPTLAGQVARTIDDTRRTTYANEDSWVPNSIQTFLQRQANKIPGLSQNQPAYTDVWGRPDTTENGWLRAFENFLSPGYIGNRNSSDAENALRELYNATGETAVLPSKPQKSYTENGEKHNLTADQWLRLSNAKGQTSLAAIDALTKTGAYQSMSDQEKVNAIKDIYDYASAVAANQVYNKELEGTIKTVHDSGIDPGLYYAYKEMEDTLNESVEGYEARDQVFNTIRNDSSLTQDQKNQLYNTLLIQGTSDSQWEKYQEISDVITAEEYVDAMIQYQAIKAYGDELEDGRAEAEATEFSYYLDSMGYDDAKRSALEDTFKYYKMFPADPTSYTFDMMRENGSQAERNNVDAIEASGVSAAQYMAIKTLTKSAKWTEGEQGAKLAAHAKIVSENTENYEQYAAIMHAMDYKNIEDAYTGAGSLPDVAAATSQVSRSSQTTSESGFVNPTKASNSVITSSYGRRNAPRTSQGYGSSNHGGIDIGGTGGNLNGQEADTIGSGTVATVGWDPGGYGNYVIINHGNGYKTLYGHLQQATVSQGQQVQAGQQIGVIGSTGNSQAPHLHLSAWYNDQEIDPATIIPGY